MKAKNLLIKIKKTIQEELMYDNTKSLFFLITDGLNSNKEDDGSCCYKISFLYNKEDKKIPLKPINYLLNNTEDGSYFDTTSDFLEVIKGNFDMGYLIELCLKNNVEFEYQDIPITDVWFNDDIKTDDYTNVYSLSFKSKTKVKTYKY